MLKHPLHQIINILVYINLQILFYLYIKKSNTLIFSPSVGKDNRIESIDHFNFDNSQFILAISNIGVREDFCLE